MKAPKKLEFGLKSSFFVSGKFKVQIAQFYTHLQSAPFLRMTKAGDNRTFSIIESDGVSTSELQVTGNRLTFNYCFNRCSAKEYAKNLIKFLSILAYSADFYDPELSSLYPSFMEALVEYMEEIPYTEGKIENSELLIRKVKTLSAMNCSLSFKTLEFQRKCKDLELENECLKKFSKDAIAAAMTKMALKDPTAESLPKIIGTTTEAYKAATAFIFEKTVTK